MEDGSVRRRWTVDREIPKFTEDRDYIDRLVFIEPALEAPEQH